MRRLELYIHSDMVENIPISERGLSRGEFNDKMWESVEGLKDAHKITASDDHEFYLVIPSSMNCESARKKDYL